MTAPVTWPRWILELGRCLPVRSQIVLSGNIRDFYVMQTVGGVALVSMHQCLWERLSDRGFEFLLTYDRMDGLGVYPDDLGRRESAAALLFANASGPNHADQLRKKGRLDVSLAGLPECIRATVFAEGKHVAFVIDYASRLLQDPQHLSADEFEFFTSCEKLSHVSHPMLVPGGGSGPLFNPVIWLVSSESDLPHWLLAGNERIRCHAIPRPDFDARDAATRKLAPSLQGFRECTPERAEALVRSFVDQTDGLPLTAMIAITQLARDEGLTFDQIEEAVLRYKVGMSENPWKKEHLKQRVREAEEFISTRVKGQRPAIIKTLDILKRSITGLTGAQASRRSGRPRGALFFAGTTSVGKSEIAKAITERLFGDESVYTRFVISEFSAEHADARMLVAPPGYVGYDAGGELTNALRARPFSVVLFDEIEKAHPRILDKFLQILEDGRLTDGRGNTVYFSEAVIVFTSNLGIVVKSRDEYGRVSVVENVKPGMKYEEVERKIREAIQHHFKFDLGRPELLNRIGDNIVVFNFIEAGEADEIFGMMLQNVLKRAGQEHGVELDVPEKISRQLWEWCTADLSNGGRGIGNCLETKVVNPLARALFDLSPAPGTRVRVDEMCDEDGVYTVRLI